MTPQEPCLQTTESNVKGLILLDSVNGGGKDYLIQAIQRRVKNSKHIHCTYRFKDRMFTYHLAAIKRALKFSDRGLAILNRSWLSEEIYANVFRAGTPWPHQGRIFQKLLLKHATLHVACILTDEEAEDQIKKHRKPGTYHSPEHVTKPAAVNQRYNGAWRGRLVDNRQSYVDDVSSTGGLLSRPDHIEYSINKEGLDVDSFITILLQKLQDLRNLQYQEALIFDNKNVMGNLATAKYLLVGDQVNYHDYKKCWPFLSYSNSTLFMAKAMHWLNLKEEDFMWTNANCPESHIKNILNLKPSLKVIALGKDAGRALVEIDSGLKFYKDLPHPSYGRRFLGLKEWTNRLEVALVG